MVQYSQCEEDELLKICLEFWKFFTEHVYEKNKNSIGFTASRTYEHILNDLRQILMNRMVKPQEVLISIDADGELIDDEEEDHEKVDLYETMKTVIIYVTNIDPSAMD